MYINKIKRIILKDLTVTQYLKLILVHVGLGAAIHAFRPSSELFLSFIWVFWLFYIILKQNRHNEALMAAAYIAGAEVFFRMTGGMIFYETGKYSVILFLLLGMFYKGTSSKSFSFWLYLLILVPGILVASFTLSYDIDFRNAIAFNLSGPVCLGISAIYCYYKKITKSQLNYILMMLILPLIANMTYLYLYTPSVTEVLGVGANSNYATSGGYGPNQVSTVLGLGAFLLATRIFIIRNRMINIIDLVLLVFMSYRSIVTFSRGGVLTAMICLIFFLVFLYYKENERQKKKIVRKLGLIFIAMLGTWIVVSALTNGLINYRYTNRNAAGEMEQDMATGRVELIETELEAFYHNPVIGVGVGKAREFRTAETGTVTASHNEITRMLAEHGLLGLLAIVILIFVPILFWLKFQNNYYFLAFITFWFLTINHSAMRIALPGFIYGLALLYIVDEKKNTVHR